MRFSSLYALHGFLGQPSDWDFLKLGRWICPDLFKKIDPFQKWASNFNQSVEPGSLLMGYSLGGRLALHALLQNPERWKGAIIVSAHPGLTTLQERRERLLHDHRWAERFLSEPWEDLLVAWNQQILFGGKQPVKFREESAYSRELLSQALKVWSLGEQENLRPKLLQLSIPILWIAGKNDQRYAPISLEHPTFKHVLVPDAHHRVPWEQQEIFTQIMTDFINEVEHDTFNPKAKSAVGNHKKI
jgi:2-succinyl-6-hydroxy-2,4-cyclohexadiene-1-carboxylate synthase